MYHIVPASPSTITMIRMPNMFIVMVDSDSVSENRCTTARAAIATSKSQTRPHEYAKTMSSIVNVMACALCLLYAPKAENWNVMVHKAATGIEFERRYHGFSDMGEMKMLSISEIAKIVPARDMEMMRGFWRTVMAEPDIVRLSRSS